MRLVHHMAVGSLQPDIYTGFYPSCALGPRTRTESGDPAVLLVYLFSFPPHHSSDSITAKECTLPSCNSLVLGGKRNWLERNLRLLCVSLTKHFCLS
uniref:Uncharacterized protein n=1 Tax=Anguilla anguilla TaxID=7936 RepID=A0A0E9WSW9_ANGAN